MFAVVFRPMVAVLNGLAMGLMRLLRIPKPDARLALHTSAELEIVTDEAADSGQLGAMQRDLIRNIFDLGERRAEELMTSRPRIEALDVATAPEEVTARIATSSRSRYVVVDGDLDHVVGVLHIKDFIRASHRGLPLDLDRLARPMPSVAATTTAEQLLARLKRDRIHASLVVDEFGGTLGFVTLDDVVAEVMEDQAVDDSPQAVVHDDGSLTLDGEVTLAELRDDYGLTLTHPMVTTIAGIVLAEYGTVPGPGVRVDFQGHSLVVDEVEGRKITRVRVRATDVVETAAGAAASHEGPHPAPPD